ncbi:hypothetical protein BU26DRAFT_513874 [Trematosphaeria pertusa]|uniref:Cell wall mannoprotein PIR1-like C-terminal domain-containing protein n=1 Tax=Trematosphaeria pertusa TaxID=390896 RepID=A0A6A6J2U7_9PLEO|nr:uncharacterized protein BU26DRAFT_513874 [Trematosphaeria pertusa]KAF2257175.1 hypothetical protein BU26DRAFT_513874 [Trematosphaeria pertusa]
MKSFVALALAASALAKPMPMPQSSTPDDCSDSHDGTFQITVLNVTQSAKRGVEKRQLSGTLTLSLDGGVLTDQAGRTGYIASNHQFQFDSPPQADALSTSGFSYCSNNTLALSGSAIWYQCWSGDFYNLYDESTGDQCSPIYIVATTGGGSTPVTQTSDGQPQAPTQVTQISDGQPQAPTGQPITQISDGQPHVPTGAPVTQISDGQPQAPTGPVISQISDGQPQVPTGGPVITQISDGQPQVPTGGPVVTQISDGQPQVPTGPVVTQISDGQPQVPTGPVVTQISDGQPQVPVATGNYTAPNATTTAPAEFTGAAAISYVGAGGLAAGFMAMLAML